MIKIIVEHQETKQKIELFVDPSISLLELIERIAKQKWKSRAELVTYFGRGFEYYSRDQLNLSLNTLKIKNNSPVGVSTQASGVQEYNLSSKVLKHFRESPPVESKTFDKKKSTSDWDSYEQIDNLLKKKTTEVSPSAPVNKPSSESIPSPDGKSVKDITMPAPHEEKKLTEYDKLWLAWEQRDYSWLNTILEKTPKLVDSQNNKGQTLLISACSEGRFNVIELLLRHDADPTKKNKGDTGDTPLLLCLKKHIISKDTNSEELQKAVGKLFYRLLAKNLTDTLDVNNLIDLMCEYNHFYMVPLLYDLDPTLKNGVKNAELLIKASKKRAYATVEQLLIYGADPNFAIEGRTALHQAVIYSTDYDPVSEDIMKILLAYGANVTFEMILEIRKSTDLPSLKIIRNIYRAPEWTSAYWSPMSMTQEDLCKLHKYVCICDSKEKINEEKMTSSCVIPLGPWEEEDNQRLLESFTKLFWDINKKTGETIGALLVKNQIIISGIEKPRLQKLIRECLVEAYTGKPLPWMTRINRENKSAEPMQYLSGSSSMKEKITFEPEPDSSLHQLS